MTMNFETAAARQAAGTLVNLMPHLSTLEVFELLLKLLREADRRHVHVSTFYLALTAETSSAVDLSQQPQLPGTVTSSA